MTRNRLHEEDTTEKNWSILSDLIKYIDRCLDMAPSLTVKPLDYRQHKRLYNSLKTNEDLTVDIEFEADKLKEEYFDKYGGISCRSLVFSGTVHWFEGRQAFIHYCGLHQV